MGLRIPVPVGISNFGVARVLRLPSAAAGHLDFIINCLDFKLPMILNCLDFELPLGGAKDPLHRLRVHPEIGDLGFKCSTFLPK